MQLLNNSVNQSMHQVIVYCKALTDICIKRYVKAIFLNFILSINQFINYSTSQPTNQSINQIKQRKQFGRLLIIQGRIYSVFY